MTEAVVGNLVIMKTCSQRPRMVRVKALDRNGTPLRASKRTACLLPCIQNGKMIILNGKLFVDYLELAQASAYSR